MTTSYNKTDPTDQFVYFNTECFEKFHRKVPKIKCLSTNHKKYKNEISKYLQIKIFLIAKDQSFLRASNL